jgi:hypothetical protein
MSGNAVSRALARLAGPGAVLAPDRAGTGYGVFPAGDRRRRPLARLSVAQVRELEGDGAIAARGDSGAYMLTEPGRARVRREAADATEQFSAQHRPIVARTVVDAEGDPRSVRGFEPNAVVRRLSAMRGASGGPWLSAAELAAAAQLRSDWEAEQAGLVRGSDWTAPPVGAGARGAGNAQERALAARCDARRRVADALARLAPPLRRIIERVCLHEEGLEALERAEGWPARSGRLALKLGLAQLAAR